MTRETSLNFALTAMLLGLIGCDYDVPITSEPTRKIEATVLGNWTSKEWTNNDCKDRMKVRRYDDASYIISYNGDLYRAYHSDLADTPFITVQNMDSPDRKYSYFTWTISEDGSQLTLGPVNADLIPRDTRDSAAVVKILRANLKNPKLLVETWQFSRAK